MSDIFDPFDTAVYRPRRIDATRPEFAWSGPGVERMTSAERTAYQGTFRQRFAQTLGIGKDWERPPLEPIVTEVKQCDGYRREAITFTTRPGLQAFGWLVVPDDCPPGQPTVLCLPGHGVGADGLVEEQEEEYSAAFALQCVRRGYPALALELIGFGRRRDPSARAAGSASSSCSRESAAALMLGETIAGWRVWDTMRALDYLETRTEIVDPTRLAVMGISGGGLVALFAAALDTRIAAAVVSGYFNTFSASVLSVDHCIDNFAPGLLALCEMPDLAALIAPRTLFVECGDNDPIFPLSGFQQAVAQAQEIFATFGVPDQFGFETCEGGHRFYGTGAFTFLEKAM